MTQNPRTQIAVLTYKLLKGKVKNREAVKAKIKKLQQRRAWNEYLGK